MSNFSSLFRNLALLAAALSFFFCPHAQAQVIKNDFSGTVSITLFDALAQREGVNKVLVPITLDLQADQGKWQRVWGQALTYNKADHTGYVKRSVVTDKTITLDVDILIGGDAYIPGGHSLYAIELQRKGEKLEGTFSGTYQRSANPIPVQGKIIGELYPLPKAPDGFTSVQPEEHPRLLFRKSDLPAMRAKIKDTAIGQICYNAMKQVASNNDPKLSESGKQEKIITLGMLYQLDGNADYALATLPIIEDLSKTAYHVEAFGLPDPWGDNAQAIAYAYDLCYDAWTPEVRAKWTNHLLQISERMIMRPLTVCKKMNQNPASNYEPSTRCAGATAALAIWGEKGKAPVPPRDPGTAPYDMRTPPAAIPDNGIAAEKLQPGVMFRNLLLAAPLPITPPDEGDTLAGLGGSAAARPTNGMTVTSNGVTRTFAPLDAAKYIIKTGYTDNLDAIDLTKCVNREFHSKAYFSAVIENDTPRLLQVRFSNPSVTTRPTSDSVEYSMWINGKQFLEDEFLYLGVGRYPVLIDINVGETDPWGVIWSMPRLDLATAEQAKSAIEIRQNTYQSTLPIYNNELAAWKASNGISQRGVNIARLGALHANRYFSYMMGDGGWQTEGEAYTLDHCRWALEYADTYRVMYGYDVSRRPNMSMFAARYVAQTIFSGNRNLFSQSFGWGVKTMQQGHYCRAFSSVPTEYAPAVLWAWNYALGLGDTAGQANGATVKPRVGGMDAVFTLLNYPTDMTPKNPAGIIPNDWAATGRGGYIFRNKWENADDIVAQVFLKTMNPGGWNQPNAGDLRLYGLGHEWAIEGVDNPKTGERMCMNVVALPEDPADESAGAVATYFQGSNDGSGALTADTSHVYNVPKTKVDATGNVVNLPTGTGFITLGENFATDITAQRAFAADYSGASGAPGLFVLVDKFTGGHKKIWQWQLPTNANTTVDIAGNTFTITQGDATLKGTVITPGTANITLERGMKTIRTVLSSKNMTFGDKQIRLNELQISGSDEFYVVFTLQRGAAPPVAIAGTGLNAKVTVGKQVISYDGEKVIFTKAE